MQIDVRPGRGRIEIGPPGGPTETIPAACMMDITDIQPYDIRLKVEWMEEHGKLAVTQATFIALPGGEPVRLPLISRLALADLFHRALEAELLTTEGWQGIVEKYADHDQVAVDALIYLLSVAMDSPKPSATVAIARGLSPASGPKRVATARQAGLLPPTHPGKASGVTA